MPLPNVRIQDLASYKCGSRCRCSLRKHPFLLALRRCAGDVETSPVAKSGKKRLYSQANVDVR